MKSRVFIVILAIFVAQFSGAQTTDYTSYLAQAWECLNSNNCDAAQRNYDMYKEMTGNRNTSLEGAISRCKQDKSTPSRFIPKGYVDLDLPSGTLWKASNEVGYYNFKDAVSRYGHQLPTSAQFDELVENCTWVWYGSGFKVIGKNGNFITLPAAGSKAKNKGDASEVGTSGIYWTPESWRTDNEDAVVFSISNSYGGMHFCHRHSKSHGFTVRLVYNN